MEFIGLGIVLRISLLDFYLYILGKTLREFTTEAALLFYY